MNVENPRRGRPPLSANEEDPTVKVNFYITKSLLGRIKATGRDLGMKDAEVFRETLASYLHLLKSEEGPDRVTIIFSSGNDLDKMTTRAAELWGLDRPAVVKMAVMKGLSSLITEGEALKKGLVVK